MPQKQYARTPASIAEHVIFDGPCRLHGISWDPSPSTSPVTIRDAGSVESVAAPTNLAATPGAAGTLDDDQYFFAVAAIDVNGELSALSTEANATTVAGAGAGSVSLNWDDVSGAVGYRVFVGLATGVYTKYFDTVLSAGSLTVPVASLTDDGDGSDAGSTGTARIVGVIPAASVSAGRPFYGMVMDRGITVELEDAGDVCTVVFERL